VEEGRTDLKILTGTPTGRRPSRRWEDNIRMDLKEIGINTKVGLIRLKIGTIGDPLRLRH